MGGFCLLFHDYKCMFVCVGGAAEHIYVLNLVGWGIRQGKEWARGGRTRFL